MARAVKSDVFLHVQEQLGELLGYLQLIEAAILMAEWRIRETPHLPIPYISPVDLRFFLTPPVYSFTIAEPTNVVTVVAAGLIPSASLRMTKLPSSQT